MSVLKSSLSNSLNPKNLIDLLKFKFNFLKNNPNYFNPDGLTIFVGPQGSGKTLSAVLYAYSLLEKYPKSIIVSNITLKDYPIDNKRSFLFKNSDDLTKYNNNKYGVIFLIDEIQLYFNSLDSKNIDPAVMVQISQQRKQRKHIIATSQVFGRMAKPLREQFSSVVLCKNFLGFFQKNMLLNRDGLDEENSTGTNLKGKAEKSFFWFHNPKYYELYDTYNIINNNFKNMKDNGEIYE